MQRNPGFIQARKSRHPAIVQERKKSSISDCRVPSLPLRGGGSSKVIPSDEGRSRMLGMQESKKKKKIPCSSFFSSQLMPNGQRDHAVEPFHTMRNFLAQTNTSMLEPPCPSQPSRHCVRHHMRTPYVVSSHGWRCIWSVPRPSTCSQCANASPEPGPLVCTGGGARFLLNRVTIMGRK